MVEGEVNLSITNNGFSPQNYIKGILYANTASRRHNLFNARKESDVLHISCGVCAFFSPSMVRIEIEVLFFSCLVFRKLSFGVCFSEYTLLDKGARSTFNCLFIRLDS